MLKIRGSSQAIGRARALKRALTPPERLLWSVLKGDQIGVRFRCQYPAGPYVLDFYCARARLAVEVDGESHELTFATDRERDAYLRQLGIRVVRVPAREVMENLDGVVRMIEAEVTHPSVSAPR